VSAEVRRKRPFSRMWRRKMVQAVPQLGGASLAGAAAWGVTELEVSTVLNDYHAPPGVAYQSFAARVTLKGWSSSGSMVSTKRTVCGSSAWRSNAAMSCQRDQM